MSVFHSARILEALLVSTPIQQSIIEGLVVANQILADQQAVDAYGHVSVRHPSNPQRFLLARDLPAALVTANDIIEYDLDGKPFGAKPGFTHFPERFIDAGIYRMRPDVNSVVHSHSPAVMPFANTHVPLKPMLHLTAFLAPNVPVFEIREAAGVMTNMLISDGKLGQSLAETLGQNAVALMRGHGKVVVASSLPLAVFRAIYTDTNARMQMEAMTAGGPITFLELEEAEKATKFIDEVHTRAWDLWKLRLRRGDRTN
jgi:HCOMODA/2-hydroxy-3-carboxy-muconic semialdehyde decarboxylase